MRTLERKPRTQREQEHRQAEETARMQYPVLFVKSALVLGSIIFYLFLVNSGWQHVHRSDNGLFLEQTVSATYPGSLDAAFEPASSLFSKNVLGQLTAEQCSALPSVTDPESFRMPDAFSDMDATTRFVDYGYSSKSILENAPAGVFVALLALVILFVMHMLTNLPNKNPKLSALCVKALLLNVIVVVTVSHAGLLAAKHWIVAQSDYEVFYSNRALLLRAEKSLADLGWGNNPLKYLDKNLLAESIFYAISTGNAEKAARYADQVPNEDEFDSLRSKAYLHAAKSSYEKGNLLLALNFSVHAQKLDPSDSKGDLINHMQMLYAYEHSAAGNYGVAFNLLMNQPNWDADKVYSVWISALRNHFRTEGILRQGELDATKMKEVSSILQTYAKSSKEIGNVNLQRKLHCLYVPILKMQAQQSLLKNEKELAINFSEAALSYIPGDSEAANFAGMVYHAMASDAFHEGNKSEAEELAIKAMLHSPETSSISEFLGKVYHSMAIDAYENGDKQRAASIGVKGLEYLEDSSDLKGFLGEIYYESAIEFEEMGFKTAAVELAKNALEHVPEDSVIKEFLGGVYFSMAVDSYDRDEKHAAIEFTDSALEYLPEGNAALDFRASVNYSIGIDLFQQGNKHGAAKYAEIALDHYKGDEPISEFLSNVNHSIAIDSFNDGNTNTAKQYFRKALSFSPNDEETQCNYATVLLAEATDAAYLERFNDAIDGAKAAKFLCDGMKEGVGNIYLMHGEWAMRNGNYREAKNSFKEVEKLRIPEQVKLARLLKKDALLAPKRYQKIKDAIKWAQKESDVSLPRISGSLCADFDERTGSCRLVRFYNGIKMIGFSDPDMRHVEIEDRSQVIIFEDGLGDGRIDTVDFSEKGKRRRLVETDGDYMLDAEMVFGANDKLIFSERYSGRAAVSIPSGAIGNVGGDWFGSAPDSYLVVKQNNNYIGHTETIDNSNFPSFREVFVMDIKKGSTIVMSMWDDDSGLMKAIGWDKDDHIDNFIIRGFPESGILVGVYRKAVIEIKAVPTRLPLGVYTVDNSEHVNIFKYGNFDNFEFQSLVNTTPRETTFSSAHTNVAPYIENEKLRTATVARNEYKVRDIVEQARKAKKNSETMTTFFSYTVPELIVWQTMQEARLIYQIAVGLLGTEYMKSELQSSDQH